MKFNEDNMKKAQEEALKILQNGEDKAQAIIDAMEKINEVQYNEIVKEILEESERAKSDKEFKNS